MKIECECGRKISKSYIKRHRETKLHKNLVKSRPQWKEEYDEGIDDRYWRRKREKEQRELKKKSLPKNKVLCRCGRIVSRSYYPKHKLTNIHKLYVSNKNKRRMDKWRKHGIPRGLTMDEWMPIYRKARKKRKAHYSKLIFGDSGAPGFPKQKLIQ